MKKNRLIIIGLILAIVMVGCGSTGTDQMTKADIRGSTYPHPIGWDSLKQPKTQIRC